MNEADVLAYVQAASHFIDLKLDDRRAHAVALQLGRTLQMARQLEAFPMALEEEPCALFCPAPFPSETQVTP